MARFNIYDEVTNRIIKQLEEGVVPWRKPWRTTLSSLDRFAETDLRKVAFNRVSKKPYSFLNQMLLSRPGEYGTFKQWHDLGGRIRSGAKAEMVTFWSMIDIRDKNSTDTPDTPDIAPNLISIPYLKYYQVFHISDVIGVEPLDLDKSDDTNSDIDTSVKFTPEQKAEDIIRTYTSRENISIYYGGNSAFYSPKLDFIQLPDKYKFDDHMNEYYSTIFHEMIHSTGAKSRLDRLNNSAFFGSESYSKEELVAEIGACGLLSLLGLESNNSFNNSVAYIHSWIQALKNDNKMIVHASSKAEKAVRFIVDDDNMSEEDSSNE